MGKMGKLLREQKQKETVYTFTAKQLADHDDFIRKQFRDRVVEQNKKAVNEYLTKEFEERQKLLTDNADGTSMQKVMCLMLSIPTRILVEQFGWKPVRKGSSNKRHRLARFAIAVEEMIEHICDTESCDIKIFAKEAYDITGVGFELIDSEES